MNEITASAPNAKHPGWSLFVGKKGLETQQDQSVVWEVCDGENTQSRLTVIAIDAYVMDHNTPFDGECPPGVKLIRQSKIKRASLSVLTAAKLLCLGLLWAVIKTDEYKYRIGRCTGDGFLTCTGTCVYMLAKQDICMKHHFSPFGHQIYCSVFFSQTTNLVDSSKWVIRLSSLEC